MLGSVGPDRVVVKGGANSGVVFDPVVDVVSGTTEGDDDDDDGGDSEASVDEPSNEVEESDIGGDCERVEDASSLVVWPWAEETFLSRPVSCLTM